MAPQPIGRLSFDGFFERLHVKFGHVMFGLVVDIINEPSHRAFVMSTAEAPDVTVPNRRINLLRDALGAGKHRCFRMIEEVDPLVDAVAFRGLVGDETDDGGRAFFFEFQNASKGDVLVNVFST